MPPIDDTPPKGITGKDAERIVKSLNDLADSLESLADIAGKLSREVKFQKKGIEKLLK